MDQIDHLSAREPAMRCCIDARWVWQHHKDAMTVAYAEGRPEYAATIAQYLPLGRWLETGVWT